MLRVNGELSQSLALPAVEICNMLRTVILVESSLSTKGRKIMHVTNMKFAHEIK